MAEGDQEESERTEDPTDRRLEEARNRGQVIHSREVGTALLLVVTTLVLLMQGPTLWQSLQEKMRFLLSGRIQSDFSQPALVLFLGELVQGVVWDLLPLFLFLLVTSIAAPLLQHGWLFSWEPVIPKFSKINPWQGLKRLLSFRSLVELGKSILKMMVVTVAVWWALADSLDKYLVLSATSIQGVMSVLVEDTLAILWRVALAFLVMAMIDYLYQRFDYRKSLRMTKQEIKDELKQMEGDPQIRGRIRQAQRELAQRRMMEEVPKATVIITNPVHFAVALRYQSGEMSAPKVVAKGRGQIALRIRERGRENQVPVVENPPLARTLFKEVGLDQSIPPQLFKAVAEVLAYVYRLKKRRQFTAR